MKAQGFSDSELDRIHGPVGLDIGALSPAEIAIAIIAQIIDVLRPKKKGVGARAA
jgi:xanthine dehydrogenase accessory factor